MKDRNTATSEERRLSQLGIGESSGVNEAIRSFNAFKYGTASSPQQNFYSTQRNSVSYDIPTSPRIVSRRNRDSKEKISAEEKRLTELGIGNANDPKTSRSYNRSSNRFYSNFENEDFGIAADDMRTRLLEFESWTETLQSRIRDLEDENFRINDLLVSSQDGRGNSAMYIDAMNEEKEAKERALSELYNLRMEMGTLENDYRILDETMRAWQNEKVILEEELAETVTLQRRLEDLEDMLYEKENKIMELQRGRSRTNGDTAFYGDSAEVTALKREVEELERQMSRLEQDLVFQERKANDATRVVDQLNFDLANKQDKIERLVEDRQSNVYVRKEENELHFVLQQRIDELEYLVQEKERTIMTLNNQLDLKDDELSSLELQIKQLSIALENSERETAEAIRQWQETARDRERTISQHLDTIERQNAQAASAISMWESRCDKLNNLIEDLNNKIEEMERIQYETVGDERFGLEDTIYSLKKELIAQKREYDQAFAEADALRNIISDLEADLMDANAELESHYADGVTTRASEEATQALRLQLQELREQRNSDRISMASERSARLAAQDEVKRLQSDIDMLSDNRRVYDRSNRYDQYNQYDQYNLNGQYNQYDQYNLNGQYSRSGQYNNYGDWW
jgi:chromosome segregation ATPase